MQEDDYLEITTHVRECMDSTFVAVLATAHKDSTWSTPIYFIYDDQFNLYFLSEAKTRHIKDLEGNPNVSLAIFTPAKDSVGFKVGLQIEGVATVVPDKNIEDIYMHRSMRLTGQINAWNKESRGGHFMKQAGYTFIKVTPKSINYTDMMHFGGESKKIQLDRLIESNKYLAL